MKPAIWRQWLPWCIVLGDTIVILLTIVVAQFVRFGSSESRLAESDVSYWFVGVLIGVIWLSALVAWRASEIRVLGSGPAEYLRVANSTLAVFGSLAIIAYVFELPLARGYVAVAVTVGLFGLLVWRWLARKTIIRFRRQGFLNRRLVIIGGPGEVYQLHRSFERSPGAGYYPVGSILPGREMQSPTGEELPLPVLSVDRSVAGIVQQLIDNKIEVVAVTGGGLSPRVMRTLSWELSKREISLILAPALTDVAGPRIHSHPVADLPLIHVSTPRLDGFSAIIKRGFDILGSVIAIVVTLPIMIWAAVAIKLDDGGPVIFRQSRVGRHEDIFTMFKFRSMVVDAEAQQNMLEPTGAGNEVLFKMKSDPRITRVGRVIRRYSVDELPQLFNVLFGSMSMVGPRPPLVSEVAKYESDAMRRLAVVPGITGLWQIGGRSDLDWEESIRLDLYYVENWSIIQDLMILVKTIRVVLSRSGAY